MANNHEILKITIGYPRLDAAAAPAFRQDLEGNLDHRPERVLLDLSQVTFIDSTGLGVLVALLKQMGPDGRIAMVGVNSSVRRLLQITRLDALFIDCENLAEAHAALA